MGDEEEAWTVFFSYDDLLLSRIARWSAVSPELVVRWDGHRVPVGVAVSLLRQQRLRLSRKQCLTPMSLD